MTEQLVWQWQRSRRIKVYAAYSLEDLAEAEIELDRRRYVGNIIIKIGNGGIRE